MVTTVSSQAYWQSILTDGFGPSSSNDWRYAGVTNSAGQPLFLVDETDGKVIAEWDQVNLLVTTSDPFVILPSRLSRTLDHMLTEHDTFRFGATLNISAGSVPNTTELYQIANFGLYNLTEMGPDRTKTDEYAWMPPTNLLKDGSDFVDFCYFINNAWGGPNITALIGAHTTNSEGDYTTGTDWTQTAMGEDHWLPEGTNLYVEVVYYGSATDVHARCANATIYTDPTRMNLLKVNGVAMSYWTDPLPAGKTFTVTDMAFYNYIADSWSDVNGSGRGTFDDAYVQQYFADGEIFAGALVGGYIITTWAAEFGKTYYVESTTNLLTGQWVTNETVMAAGETASTTNSLGGDGVYYRVTD